VARLVPVVLMGVLAAGCVSTSVSGPIPVLVQPLLATAPDSATNGCIRNPLLCRPPAGGEEVPLCPPLCAPPFAAELLRTTPSEKAICRWLDSGVRLSSPTVLCDYECEGAGARIALPMAMTRCPGVDGAEVAWASLRREFTVVDPGSKMLPLIEAAPPEDDQLCKPRGSGGANTRKSPWTCTYQCGSQLICIVMPLDEPCPGEKGPMSPARYALLKRYPRCKR
jgi:hypothetical protein